MRRIATRIKVEENKAIMHKLRGKPSNRKKPLSLKEKVLNLYRNKYHDFGPTFTAEKLSGLDKINMGKETLRGWLIEAGLHKKRRKPRPHRLYRERKHSFFRNAAGRRIKSMPGFQKRGPKASFLGCIDDATNNVFGRFYTHEGTIPELDQLGVKIIYANSPQAKGRIERLFETFQDRLVKELRLAGIDNINDANVFLEGYLPLHNKKFSFGSLSGIDMHRKPHANIKSALCIKGKRVLRNDNTISYCSTLYQILDRTVVKKVDVEEHLDGNIYLNYKGKKLRYSKIDKRPEIEKLQSVTKQPTSYRPKLYHPWRVK